MKNFIFIMMFLFLSSLVSAQDAKMSFLYPAGGQRGTTTWVYVGGRGIAKASEVVVSGDGITASIERVFTKTAMNNSIETVPARRLYEEEKRLIDAPEAEREAIREEIRLARQLRLENPGVSEDERAMLTDAEIVERYPFFREMVETRSPEAVQTVFYEYFGPRPDRKPAEALNQWLLVKVEIAPQAEPGDRAISLRTPAGMTSPMTFQVGTLPELTELEPNDTPELPTRWNNQKRATELLATAQLPPAALPVVFNGQICAGDVDRWTFTARAGQKLTLYLRGRALHPYMADAVPGWFQPVITLYDSSGNRIAYADSWKFEPDPTLLFDVPTDGQYTVEVKDSLFRGRKDFVYRLAVGEFPFLTGIYPPCGEVGKPFTAKLKGRNLPTDTLTFENLQPDAFPTPDTDGLSKKTIAWLDGESLVRPISITLEDSPVVGASADSATPEGQKVTLPVVCFGRLDEPGQVATFSFDGKRDERVAIDVTAQAVDSTLDGVLEILAPDGTPLAKNDDRADSAGPNFGLRTHHSDPLLDVTLPQDGTYKVRLYSAYSSGAQQNTYRIRIAPSKPNFLLICTQPNLNFGTPTALLRVQVVRLGGTREPIELYAPDDIPGLRVDCGVIPADRDMYSCTVTATNEFWTEIVPDENGNPARPPRDLRILGVARSGESAFVREVLPVEDCEQAFIYHHFLPSRSLTASFRSKRTSALERLTDGPVGPVELKVGETTEIQLVTEAYGKSDPPKRRNIGKDYFFELASECAGIELESWEFTGENLTLRVRVADPEKAAPSGNLIFEIRRSWQVGVDKMGNPRKPSPPYGWVPALPYRVVK